MTDTMTDQRDQIFATGNPDLVDFAFDSSVAGVFSDMIRRSVPGYETVVPMTGLIAARHLANGANCYDLGCSLGAGTLAVVHRLEDQDCRLIAVDNSAAMLERAQSERDWDPRVEFVCADLRDVNIENAGAVIMNYTLQFIPPDDRLALLTRIREGLNPDGVLILSEKVASDPATEELHLEFKRANGYSELEIAGKRAALENVMIPDEFDTHLERFADAGFSDSHAWFECLNWASFIARP